MTTSRAYFLLSLIWIEEIRNDCSIDENALNGGKEISDLFVWAYVEIETQFELRVKVILSLEHL